MIQIVPTLRTITYMIQLVPNLSTITYNNDLDSAKPKYNSLTLTALTVHRAYNNSGYLAPKIVRIALLSPLEVTLTHAELRTQRLRTLALICQMPSDDKCLAKLYQIHQRHCAQHHWSFLKYSLIICHVLSRRIPIMNIIKPDYKLQSSFISHVKHVFFFILLYYCKPSVQLLSR